MTDALRFEPASVTVNAGETVRFVVSNSGSVDHEFYVGDAAAQAQHGMAMAGGEMMHDDPNGMAVPAGESRTLDVTFDEPGQLFIGCHVAGHYEAGMKADVVVSP